MTGFPDGPPVKTGNSAADYLAGMHLAVGVLAALRDRATSGAAQSVDVSLLEPVLACLDGFPLYSSIAGITPSRSGNFHPAAIPAYSVFPTADGHIAIGAAGASFTRLMTLLQRTDLDVGLMPSDEAARRAWFDEVVEVITSWTAGHPRAELHELLDGHDVPNEPVRTLAEVWSDPQLEARGMFLEYEYGDLGTIRTIGSPIHLSSSPREVRHVPPAAGEHNEEILRDVLGYGDAEVVVLHENGALWGALDD